MADIASLTIKVENKGLDEANRGLEKLVGAAKKAEGATDKLGDTASDTANDQRKLKSATDQASDAVKNQVTQAKNLSSTLSKVKALLTGTIAGFAVGKTVSVAREFDVLNAQLITATGSMQNAKDAFAILQEFAATTPYSLQQSVEGFTKLVNLGLTPSEEAMRSYGNTASAMGADLSQMIEAVADASTFEFERLKAFGIKAKQEKDNVAFTFQGVTTTVAKNAAEIEQYLMKIGNVNFAGAMAQRMDTLDGAISNLNDNINSLFLSIANSGVSDFLKDTLGIINRNFTELATIAGGVASIAMVKFATATFGAVNVVKVLGAVISKHPLMIMAGVIGGVVTAVFGLDNVIKELSTGFNVLGVIAGDLFSFIGTGFQGLGDLAYAFYVNNTSNAASSTNQSTRFFGNFFSGVGTGFQGLLVGTARIFDAMGGGARGVAIYMGRKFGQFVVNVSNFFTRLGNKVFSIFEAISGYAASAANFGVRQVNKIIKAANALPELLGFGKQISEFSTKFEGIKLPKGSITSAIDVSFSQSMAEGFKVQNMAVENLAKSYFTAGKAAKKSSIDLSQFKKSATGTANAAKGLGKGAGKAAKGAKKAGRAAKKAAQGVKRLSDAQKQAKQRADQLTKSFANQYAALHKQIALFYDKSKLAALNYDIAFGELKGLDNARANELRQLTQKLTLLEKIKKQQQEEVSLREKYDKVSSINNEYQKNIAKIATNPYLSKDDKSVFRAEEERKRQSALDEYRKPYTDITDRLNGVTDNPYAKLQEQYDAEGKIILKYTTDNEKARQDALLKLRKEFQQKEALLAIGHGQQMASSLASITGAMLGKQSKAYRIMFAIEKGFAIAQASLSLYTSAMKAMATGLTPIDRAINVASALTQGAKIVAMIQSVRQPSLAGQAHDGLDYVPREGTYLLDKGERVIRPQDNKRLSKFLDNGNTGNIQVEVHNYSGANVETQQTDDGKLRIIVGEEINKQMPAQLANFNSATSKALKNNWNVVARR